MRFRSILFAISAAAVTIPCMVMGYFQYSAFQREFVENEKNREQIARLVSERVDSKVQTALTLVKAASEVFKTEGPKETEVLSEMLKDLNTSSPDILNIHFDDAEAVSLAFSPKHNSKGVSNVGVSHKERAHWKTLNLNKPVSVSGLVKAVGASDREIVNVTQPVFKNGKFIGLTVAALDLKHIFREIMTGLPTKEFSISIFDNQGKVIFSSDGLTSSRAFSFIDSQKGHFSFSNDDFYGYIRPLTSTDWYVSVLSRHADRRAELTELLLKNLLVWFGTAFTALLIGYAASVSVARAVDKLSRQMTAARSRPDKNERISSPKELVNLQRTYGRMQEKLTETQSQLNLLNRSLEQKVSEQVGTIREQETILSALFSDMNEGFVLFAKDFSIRFSNPSAVRLLGLEDEKSAKTFTENITKLLKGNRKHAFFKCRGQELEIRLLESEVRDSSFAVFVRDATAEVQIDRLKDEIIGVAAHELKTPLAGIRLEAECLKKMLKDPECIEIADELLESTDEMKAMISRWLDVAKLQSGSYPLTRELCLVRPIINKVLRHFAGLKDFECRIDISEEARAAFVDKQAFAQILQNLLGNAYKYRKEGQICRTTVTVKKEGSNSVFLVSDNGIGLEQEEKKRVFERFYQVRMDSARKVSGTGLGLFIVKELTELHGGKVSVISDPEKGSIFRIEIPMPEFRKMNKEESS